MHGISVYPALQVDPKPAPRRRHLLPCLLIFLFLPFYYINKKGLDLVSERDFVMMWQRFLAIILLLLLATAAEAKLVVLDEAELLLSRFVKLSTSYFCNLS